MSKTIRVVAACAAGMLSLSACATKGALREGLEMERSARIAGDSANRADMQREVASLRTDLTALRTEFGAKISEVAEGMKFALPVHFAYDDATVRQADAAALERFASVAQKHYPGAKITVEGFADPAGSARYNLDLSRRRAESVRSFIGEHGVDPTLVNAVGYGETRLVRRDASRDMPGAELNRRVVFVIETPASTEKAVASN
jgi:peptidoglycan-associated lipoprotein